MTRAELKAILAKPIPTHSYEIGVKGFFHPWDDIIPDISGTYNSACDDLMIGALEAVRDKTNFEFIENEGFVGEFALYVLSGHGLTDYGTSPRGGWPDLDIADLWDELIEKWKAYSEVAWRD